MIALLEVIKLYIVGYFGRISNTVVSVVNTSNVFRSALTVPYELISILPSFLGISLIIVTSVGFLKFLLGR